MRSKKLPRTTLRAFVGLVFLFLTVPLAIIFPVSLSSSSYLQFPPPGFSLRWFENYLMSPVWMAATARSLQLAVTTVVLTLAIALPLAFALTRGTFPGRAAIERLMLTPLIVPTIVTAIAIYSIFSQLKLLGSFTGLAVAHSILALPFASSCCRRASAGSTRTSRAPPRASAPAASRFSGGSCCRR
jgi:putative spermidine/putrescine transport system permease protein